MATVEFRLPDVGEGLAEAEIVRWHARPGEAVKADQTLVEIETDKAIVEIPSPATGTLVSIGGEVGDVLPVGEVLATIDADSSAPALKTDGVGSESSVRPPTMPTEISSKRSVGTGRVKASPAVRKAARDLGIDLQTVTVTGDRGQVTRADLDAAHTSLKATSAEQPRKPISIEAPTGADRVEPLRGLRRRIAETMTQSWREIPHIYNQLEVDASQLVAARNALNDELKGSVRLSYMPFFTAACALALKAMPRFNACLDVDAGDITYRHRCNIGIATATHEGLLVPVVHDADQRGLTELAREIERLAALARARKATPEALGGGTFTISNFGAYGEGMGMPIIRPPEVAIAGFGRIRDQVVAERGVPAVKPVLPVIISADHRLNDGSDLGAFTERVVRYLREPARLLSSH